MKRIIALGLIVILALETNGYGAMSQGAPWQFVLMLFCGVVTVVPLALFASAAQKVSMFMLGLTEYISPTLSLLLGVFVYREPFDRVQFLAILIIWIGLMFFSVGEFRENVRTSVKRSQRFKNAQTSKRLQSLPRSPRMQMPQSPQSEQSPQRPQGRRVRKVSRARSVRRALTPRQSAEKSRRSAEKSRRSAEKPRRGGPSA